MDGVPGSALDREHGKGVVSVLACVLERLVAANNQVGKFQSDVNGEA